LRAIFSDHLDRRQGDRWRNAESSTEAIVSSDDPQRIKGAAPAVQGALPDYAVKQESRRLDRAGLTLLLRNGSRSVAAPGPPRPPGVSESFQTSTMVSSTLPAETAVIDQGGTLGVG
jgi:hypothetical protein